MNVRKMSVVSEILNLTPFGWISYLDEKVNFGQNHVCPAEF